jgi:hypothetical protein
VKQSRVGVVKQSRVGVVKQVGSGVFEVDGPMVSILAGMALVLTLAEFGGTLWSQLWRYLS